MREILFRGKRKDSGWWEVGDFARHTTSDKVLHAYINGYDYEVHPETVGQYTGLTDKNGKKIFEGDVVCAHFRNTRSKQTFCVVFDDGIFLFDNGFVSVPKYDIYAMTVIGNIHDNPELLGGADNG